MVNIINSSAYAGPSAASMRLPVIMIPNSDLPHVDLVLCSFCTRCKLPQALKAYTVRGYISSFPHILIVLRALVPKCHQYIQLALWHDDAMRLSAVCIRALGSQTLRSSTVHQPPPMFALSVLAVALIFARDIAASPSISIPIDRQLRSGTGGHVDRSRIRQLSNAHARSERLAPISSVLFSSDAVGYTTEVGVGNPPTQYSEQPISYLL